MSPRITKIIAALLCLGYGLLLIFVAFALPFAQPGGGTQSPLFGHALAYALVYFVCGAAVAGAGGFILARRGALNRRAMALAGLAIVGGVLVSIATADYARHHKISGAQMIREDLKRLDGALDTPWPSPSPGPLP